MSKLPCPYCGFNCEIPSNIEEKIKCPSCGSIFLYSQRSTPRTIDCRPSPKINDQQMSELKAYEGDCILDEEVYLKPEADKVIAELEETLKNSRNARKYWRKEYLIEYKDCQHQKYKRCIAMAKWCKAEQTYSSFAIYITEHPESRWANKSVGAGNWIAFWKNRERRWLELAELFKDKET